MAFSGFLLALFCRAFGFLRICEDDGSSSIDVSVFISETFLPGNVNRSISEPIPVQDDDQSMKVSGFLKTRAWGIVSLAGALESMKYCEHPDSIQKQGHNPTRRPYQNVSQ